jgi:hypothetical protein
MKILIYFVLIIAFLMFYQQSPVFAVVLIVIFLAAYMYYKAKKGGNSFGRGGFFSGNHPQNQDNINDLITLMMLQQMVNKPANSYTATKLLEDKSATERERAIEKTGKEILQLLEE